MGPLCHSPPTVRIHHLDCCTLCPRPERAIHGRGSLLAAGRMPSHCLLVETESAGLVLVDTGIGTADVADPARLGRGFVRVTSPVLDPARTALAQVRALGFAPEDVRHVVLTHLDLDHAGGLPDFPWADVHVHADELAAARARATHQERSRYRREHLAHGPHFVPFSSTGEAFLGLPAVRGLAGLPADLLAVPMPGHTRGHACVAVRDGERWLFHAGDAYFHHSTVEGGARPLGLVLFERLVAMDFERVRANHARLAELSRERRKDVRVFCAHDGEELARARASTPRRPAG